MSNGAKCLAIHGQDCVSKADTSNEEDKFEAIATTVEQLSNSFDTLLDYLGSKGFDEPEEKDMDEENNNSESEELKEVEETEEAKEGAGSPDNVEASDNASGAETEEVTEVENTSLSYEDVVNFLREHKVSEENFDSLLEVAENLSTELNSFLEQNIN